MRQPASKRVTRLGLAALVLAILGGVAAVIDLNYAIAGYYPVAAVAIGLATIGLSGAAGPIGLGLGRLLTAGLVAVNLVLAFLLAFATMMCACSRPLPPPITPGDVLLSGLHMAGAFGAAALLGAAAILQAKSEIAARRAADGK
jgi:hypothetical protein